MNKFEVASKPRTTEEVEKIYELANWLQYKGVEDEDNYWLWHLRIQNLIQLIESFHPQYHGRYYNEYFFEYIVKRDNWRSKDPKDHYTREDWERDFPNDYEKLLNDLKPELESLENL